MLDLVVSVPLAGRNPQAARILRGSALVTLVIGAVLALIGAS